MTAPRSQPLLPAVLGLLLVTSGAAFGLTFATQLEWQQRDAVTATVDDVTFSEPADTGPRVAANLSVGNPLDRPVDVSSLRLLVFEGDPPPDRDDRLSVPRSATVERVTIPARGTVTVRARADVRDEDVDRTRRALANGTSNSRGLLTLQLAGREFEIDVE